LIAALESSLPLLLARIDCYRQFSRTPPARTPVLLEIVRWWKALFSGMMPHGLRRMGDFGK